MKKTKIIIALVFMTTFANAQISLKIYNEFLVEYKINHQYYDTSLHKTFKNYCKNTTVLQPTIAIQWRAKKKKNFHQFEVNRFKINLGENYKEYSDSVYTQVVGGYKMNEINIAFRYEFIKHIISDKFSNHQLFLGFGVNPFFERNQQIPVVSSQFPETYSSLGLKLMFTPRYVYHINKRFFVDFNLPINVIKMDYQFKEIKNPVLTHNQQRYTVFNLEVLPKYFSARISLGINL